MTYGKDSSEPSDTPQQTKQAGSIRKKGENNYNYAFGRFIYPKQI